MEINKNKEFLDIASKAIMNYYESIMPIKDFDDLKKIKIEPFNLEEAAVSIMSDIRKTGCYTTYDFLADIKYYVDNTKIRDFIEQYIKQSYLYDLIDDGCSGIDYNTFSEISNILNSVESGLKEYDISLKKIFGQLNISGENLNLFLSGKEEDFKRFQEIEFDLSNDVDKISYMLIMCLYAYYISFVIEKPSPGVQGPFHYLLVKTLGQLNIKKFYELKSLHLDKYYMWKDYILDNITKSLQIMIRDDVDPFVRIVYVMTISDIIGMDSLNHYFHIINSRQSYSDKYRNQVIYFLKLEEYSVIRPYYEEYCKTHNIPVEKAYYIGQNITKVVEEHENRLLVTKNERPDADKNEHFCLALDFGKVEEIYNRLNGCYISSDTDINLFCYRLTGKNRPKGELSKIHWIADIKSLVLFIKRVLRQNYGSWKKTCMFFDCGSEVLSENRLKVTASRILGSKGLIYDERNLVELDEILGTILNTSK